jgi:hypothetical protein
MDFPNDWAKFLEDYSFRDHKEFYTNGARLIPTFRVEQMMHHYLRKAAEDIVKVVRCKDCKRYVENKEAFVTYCKRGLRDVYAKPDDFCSYGERKDNERKAD